MSSLFKSDAKRRAGTRLITGVIRELQAAFESEKKHVGLTQAAVAEKLGTSATVVSRWLKGAENLTLRSIAELAFALGYEVVFKLQRRSLVERLPAERARQASSLDQRLEGNAPVSHELASAFSNKNMMIIRKFSEPLNEAAIFNECFSNEIVLSSGAIRCSSSRQSSIGLKKVTGEIDVAGLNGVHFESGKNTQMAVA